MRGEVVDIPVVVGVHTVVQADYTVVVSLVVGPERMVEGNQVLEATSREGMVGDHLHSKEDLVLLVVVPNNHHQV
jgi:hypothetical protein